MTLGFVAFCLVLAFAQRPGWATSDTKIDLHVDPVRFLGHVASVWSPTTDLGEVHSAQYSGYLWPMGPFFAALHSIGLGPWVVQRLWLALVFALSAWGMLRLLDILVGRRRGIAHLVATTFYLLNPYTVLFSARTSITLLGYAALPWLLIIVYHGVRAVHGWRGWRGWWWAAAFALILTSIGGGVNAAVVGYMLVGPLVLLLYEPATRSVRWRDSAGFLARVGVLGVLASLWWIAPLLVHVRYGIDFLQFTEQPRSIWATNSITESLRLMGYWTSYIGVGFGLHQKPFFSDSSTLLFNPLVLGASLLLPALAVTSFVWNRRWRYGPFFLALVVVGAVIMMAGFPAGTPLRGAMESIYHNVFVLRFLRTTNKAAPLVAVGLAGLLGLGAQLAWTRLRALRPSRIRRTALIAGPIGLATIIMLAALPLVRGGALDTQLVWKTIPAAWRATGSGLNSELPQNSRALVLPGSIFAYYSWGGTIDPILPRLTHRPVAVRYETPYSDLHAVDLLTTVDTLVQQQRLLPGQLLPLLRLMGARAVVSGSDYDVPASGTIDPAAGANVIARSLGRPSRTYGPVRSFPPASGDIGPPIRLPEVRRYDVPAGRGIVHVDPAGPATIVDGGAGALAGMAAFGDLPDRAPILYAGDLSTAALRQETGRGGQVVVSDSNRRRTFLPEFPQQNVGSTLTAASTIDKNSAVIDPFPPRGTDAQTVSVLRGARYIRAPSLVGKLEFPEHRPIAAFDGDPSTSWVADQYLETSNRWIEIGLQRPRDVPYLDVYPLSGAHGVVTEVDVNGIRSHVGLGWTRIPVHLRRVTRIRVHIDHVVQPKVGLGGGGGFHEIRIPGVNVHELLRAPIVAGRALAGRDLRHVGLTYLFERTTGDNPFLRDRYTASPVLNRLKDRGDGERYIYRAIFAPTTRPYMADAWVNPAVDAPDPALDRLVGRSGAPVFDSSSRFHDQPRYRASSAFDGRADTAWIGVWVRPDSPPPWIAWTSARPLSVSRLRLTPPRIRVRRPTKVQLSWNGGTTPPLPVAADGSVVLPRPARAQAFRLTILTAQFPRGTTPRERAARAVGIASLSVPGLRPVAVPSRGPVRAACGAVRINVGGRVVPLQPFGSIAELDAGQPLRARSCAGAVRMPAGIQLIRSLPGPFNVDLLRLRSLPPVPPPPASGGGSVVNPGRVGNSSVDGVRVALSGPSWLVLGQSFDQGWRATCEGRSLGPPRVVDGFGNGWLAPGGCRRVAFSFAPQNGVRLAYVISAATCVLLAVFLLVGRPLRRERRETSLALLPDSRPLPMPLMRAAALALVVTFPFCLVFALRYSLVMFPMLTVILWRGIAPRVLAGAAAAILGLAVPIAYLLISPHDRGGYNFAYSTELLWAHWIGLAAVVLLGAAGWRMLAASRSRGRGRGPQPPSAGDMPPEPTGDDLDRELAGAGRRAASD